PGALMGGFTYLALRGSQELSPEDQPKYRRYALQELFESLLVSEVGWGVTYGGLQGLFTLFGWSPVGMTLKLGIYGLSALAGGFLMGTVSGKRRQQFRREIKADAFREVLFSLEQLPSKQKYWRAREFEKIDKKLATIINIAALEQPTVSAAVKQAATKTGYNYSYPAVIDFNTVEGWTRNMLMKQSTPTVPVILLQSQQKRLEGLWERGLSDAMHFATNPQPLVIQRDALGLIDPNQFENWGISHAMALLSQYLKMREELH
ncbi:MAG: hypothetical protein Q7S68_05345, partial [Deltaproteobacteria bacterium]|nr:hypothetical protein [Deltaproteobacteria bacterium]